MFDAPALKADLLAGTSCLATAPELPAPLTPSDCDLRNYGFMPLWIERWRRTKEFRMAKRQPELAFYHLNLCTASWHELPAASLDDDDDVLADLAGCDPANWAAVRAKLLDGWVKCADGRLYHPFIAELALEAWVHKQEFCSRMAKARAAKARKQASASQADEFDQGQANNRSIVEQMIGLKGEGKGEDEYGGAEPQRRNTETSAAKRQVLRNELAQFEEFWRGYPRKVGEEAARTAWCEALRKASAVEIMAGLHWQKWPAEERYIPYPSKWLKESRWKDPAPTRPAAPTSELRGGL